MKSILTGLAIASLLTGCASYDDDRGGTSSGSDRTLGTGDTSSSTNDIWRDGTLDQSNGRLGDAPH
jgi:hypothetical protein